MATTERKKPLKAPLWARLSRALPWVKSAYRRSERTAPSLKELRAIMARRPRPEAWPPEEG